MTAKTDARLTPSQRLSRGLKYTAVGPVDITRGTAGLSWHGAQSAAGRIRHRLDNSRLAAGLEDAQETLAEELAAAQEVLANLPQALQKARRSRRRPRPLVFIALGAVTLAGGAVAFSIIRRSGQSEPSVASQSRPPSVDVAPKP